MDLKKLKHTKKEKETIKELSRKLSKYLGEPIEIGSPNVVPITYSGVSTREAIREWFKWGREKMKLAELHDRNIQEK